MSKTRLTAAELEAMDENDPGIVAREYRRLQEMSRGMTAEQWCRTPEADALDRLYDLLESRRASHTTEGR